MSVLVFSPWDETEDTKVALSVFSINVYKLSSTFEIRFQLLVIFTSILRSFLLTICFAFHSFLSSCCGNYLTVFTIHRSLLKERA